MKTFLLSALTLLTAIFATLQAEASCDVGPVLFRDTLYGTAIGTGVGALVLLSTSSSSNIVPTLATSALVGAGVGLVVGVVEISLSNCSTGGGSRRNHGEDVDNYGFNLKPLVTVVTSNSSYETSPSIQEKHSDFFSLNQLGGGIMLDYSF